MERSENERKRLEAFCECVIGHAMGYSRTSPERDFDASMKKAIEFQQRVRKEQQPVGRQNLNAVS